MAHRFLTTDKILHLNKSVEILSSFFYFLTDNPPRGKLTALHTGSEAVPLGMTPIGEDYATVDVQQLNLGTVHASIAGRVAENRKEVPAASVFTGKS